MACSCDTLGHVQGKTDLKSVRLERRERELLRSAARHADMSESEFIRDAIARRAETVLADNLAARLEGLIASVHGRGPAVGHRTSEAFGELLLEDKKAWRRSS